MDYRKLCGCLLEIKTENGKIKAATKNKCIECIKTDRENNKRKRKKK